MINIFKKNQKEPKNLKEISNWIKFLEKDLKEVSKDLEKLKEENQFSIKKIGIIRFNPFKESGGDQSFSIALLNDSDSGVVITSLYSREENRVYGKPIENGISKYSLSKEEEKVIEQAKNFRNIKK